MKLSSFLLSVTFLMTGAWACQQTGEAETRKETQEDSTTTQKTPNNSLILEGETHLKNIRQLTDGGDNAEAYFSFDNSMAVFQSNYKDWGVECDQIFYFDIAHDKLMDKAPKMISTGKGRTTCSYFLPGDSTIVYASTHLGGEACPPEPGREEGYVWPIYESFDIFTADLEGNILRQLTRSPGYDAEATVSPQGDKIVFTSTRSGDLELWTMNIDGSDQKQVTKGLGYDGGAFSLLMVLN